MWQAPSGKCMCLFETSVYQGKVPWGHCRPCKVGQHARSGMKIGSTGRRKRQGERLGTHLAGSKSGGKYLFNTFLSPCSRKASQRTHQM